MDNLESLIQEAQSALHPPKSCIDCGDPLGPRSKTGLCVNCRTRRANYSKGRKCENCGKPIINRSQLGLCRACVYLKVAFTDGKVCQFCGKRIANYNKSECCQDCRIKHLNHKNNKKYGYHKAYRSVTKENKQKRKTKKRGKCRLCKKEFWLEGWQHSSLHWCPACRRGETYQEYSSLEFRGYRYGVY